MAEPTERPAEQTVTAPTPAAATPAGAPDDTPRIYSSVSVVAILGLVLSALYALVVGLGALVALFNHTPWILPVWTLVLPVLAAGVCFAARARIRKSEGALTGVRLTTWGVGLAAAVGLLYAAYYGGCYFAVSSQAKKFADDWMDLVQKGHVDQAFLYTLKAPRPADDDGLRDRLEMDFDRGPSGHGGALTGFRQCELVRQFEQGAGSAKVEFEGVQNWGYDKGAYTVTLEYRITTSAMVSEMVATTIGQDDENGERQWYMMEPQPIKPPALTEEGERLRLWNNQAREFADDWLGKVEARDGEGAYLDTLTPSERERQKKEHGAAFDAGLKAFRDGGLVQFDPDKFWVGPKGAGSADVRTKVQKLRADRVRGFFAADRKEMTQWLLPRALPEIHRDGDAIRIIFNVEFTPVLVPANLSGDKPPPQPDTVIQGRVALTADVSRGDPSKDQWRVESLELLSAKSTAGAGTPLPQAPRPGTKQ